MWSPVKRRQSMPPKTISPPSFDIGSLFIQKEKTFWAIWPCFTMLYLHIKSTKASLCSRQQSVKTKIRSSLIKASQQLYEGLKKCCLWVNCSSRVLYHRGVAWSTAISWNPSPTTPSNFVAKNVKNPSLVISTNSWIMGAYITSIQSKSKCLKIYQQKKERDPLDLWWQHPQL